MTDMTDKKMPVEQRLRDYTPCLNPDVCIADRGAVDEATARIITLKARIAELEGVVAEANSTIIAFAGPWAAKYADEFGLPKDHLHSTHYDILAKAGARMDDFTRATKEPQDG